MRIADIPINGLIAHSRILERELASALADVERMRGALKEARNSLQFWMEHNRESEAPMLLAGQDTLKTMRQIHEALTTIEPQEDGR